jgi:hypothetical protein
MTKRVISVPVLAVLGVAETGEKCLLQVRLAASLLLVADRYRGLKNA